MMKDRHVNWPESANNAEHVASQRDNGTDALLLILIDEIRGLREDIRDLPDRMPKPPRKLPGIPG